MYLNARRHLLPDPRLNEMQCTLYHVCTRMKLCLVQSPVHYRHRVFYGLEFLSGVMDWSIGVEPWVVLTGAIFFPRPLPGFQFYFVKKKLTKLMFSQHHFLVSLIDFYITSESVVMPSGHFREYILHLTMASRWLHDIAKPSHQHRLQNYYFVYRS